MTGWLSDRFEAWKEVVWTRAMVAAQGVWAAISYADTLARWLTGNQTSVIPSWPWYVWAIGALVLAFVVAMERLTELEHGRKTRLRIVREAIDEQPIRVGGDWWTHRLSRVRVENLSETVQQRMPGFSCWRLILTYSSRTTTWGSQGNPSAPTGLTLDREVSYGPM